LVAVLRLRLGEACWLDEAMRLPLDLVKPPGLAKWSALPKVTVLPKGSG
jgi:hypothetical protein